MGISNLKNVYGRQRRTGEGRLLAKDALAQKICRRDDGQAEENRKASYCRFAVSEMEPAAQRQVVEPHIGLECPECLPEIPPRQSRQIGTDRLVDPEVALGQKMQPEHGADRYDRQQDQRCDAAKGSSMHGNILGLVCKPPWLTA